MLIVIYVTIRFEFVFALPGSSGPVPRHPDHDRRLLALRAGGDGRDRRRAADHPRLLDLRHDHHLRPRAREHPAHAAVELRGDREPVALGDDPPLAGDDASSRSCRSSRSSSSAATRSRTSRSRSSSASPPARTRRSSSRRRSWPSSRSASPSTPSARTPASGEGRHGRREVGGGARGAGRGRGGARARRRHRGRARIAAEEEPVTDGGAATAAAARREARRKRRRARPHGRAR